MRMRRRNNLEPRMAACESVWIHDPEARRGHWRELMPDCRELRVEVGCGRANSRSRRRRRSRMCF